MICLEQHHQDSSIIDECQIYTESLQLINQVAQNSETTLNLPRFKPKQSRQRRKPILYGDKDRSSALYKYIKEKQRSYLDSKVKASNSFFSPEEDRILLLLVKKLGPKFQKITKYFPGKTMNMLKNRYYKSLKDSEASIVPREIEEELAIKDKEKRVMGRKIIKIWPEEQRMTALIENSVLFPEAKQRIQDLFLTFTSIIGNCMKFV
ncbi:unnamed protein product [Paramecium pentaurelia]|uniref:HTH myb-type domain-containing protein n=1 Tax=Paramecium pentaurelia TaxID=43138 RepID=A0A8S1URT7_9CILI|nr:unnamed protein product [Paramecium pentaurelia]